MRDRECKAYLRALLSEGEEIKPEKKAETVALCLEVMRRCGDCTEEERTGFMQFLSAVFRFEGMSVFGLQAGVLFIVCMWVVSIDEILWYIPAFTPLFALAAMPTLFRSQYYHMSEMESATRASGAEIILAKLILTGAANLVCLTVFLCLGIYLKNDSENVGQMILYGLVPYLVCMTAILRFIRRRKKERASFCAAAGVLFSMGCGLSARVFPWLYETAAAGIWLVLFVVFTAFFGGEIYYMIEMGKEGKCYGIIG